jgi:Tfp pilus assembly protein PilX
MRNFIRPLKKANKGSILVVSVIMLGMLAGLSISTLSNIATEFLTTQQNQDQLLAKQAADFAVAEAKRLILSNVPSGGHACSTFASACSCPYGVCIWQASAFSGLDDVTAWSNGYFDCCSAVGASPNNKVAAAPRYFVVALGCNPLSKTTVYRIIARGYGASINTRAYSQSYLEVGLSGQNAYPGSSSPVWGWPSWGGNTITFYLGPSTTTGAEFDSSWWGGWCPQGNYIGASCEMNCLGQVRVKGYSAGNTGCNWVYGDWSTGGINYSRIPLYHPYYGWHDAYCWRDVTANPTPTPAYAPPPSLPALAGPPP